MEGVLYRRCSHCQELVGEIHSPECPDGPGPVTENFRTPRAPRFLPLRGRAVLARDEWEVGRDRVLASGIVIPNTVRNPRHERIHVGRILALGPPALQRVGKRWHPVPWDCSVGDLVFYVFGVALEKLRSQVVEPWGDVVIVAQVEIQAVIENG